MSTTAEPVWLHNLAGEQVGAVRAPLVALWHDERLDQSDTFGLTIAANHPKADLLIEDTELRYRDRVYRIDEVEDRRDRTAVYREVRAEALWVELGDSDIPGTTVIDTNPAAGLTAILDGSRWTLGDRTTLGGDTYSLEETDATRLALLRTWAKITGLNLVFDTVRLTVDLVETRGRDLGLAYRYRRNVIGHYRRRRPPVATVLLPYGADELTIAGVNGGNPEVSDFTYYTDRGLTLTQAQELKTRRKVWVDTSFVRDTNLYDAAVTRIEALSAEQITYKLDVLDDETVTDVASEAVAGDRVRVADPEFDIDVRVTVVRRYTDLLDPTNDTVELATLDDPLDLDQPVARTNTPEAWEQFVAPIAGNFQVRTDGLYTAARLPLRFRTGGRANIHANVAVVGVGSGDVIVSVYDDDANLTLYTSAPTPYTDTNTVRVPVSFAMEDLSGIVDLRLRVTTIADGGPSSSTGVDISADIDAVASFYAMTQGAVQETPTYSDSVVYNYTGAVQSFTVPDNVEEVLVTCEGAAGGGAAPGSKGAKGYGGLVEARFTVVPGTTYDVYVGGSDSWPNGGDGAQANGNGNKGGGATYLIPAALAAPVGVVTGAIIVAGGGGGGGDADTFAPGGDGGDGAYLVGGAGTGGTTCGGGTQSAGGAGGGGGEAGDTDGHGFGGDGVTGSGAVVAEGGGGGGGWHGGGGSGRASTSGGGGGGSGYIDPAGTDLRVGDGSVADDGRMTIAWESPLDNL